jgi:1,2-phenylacetyl-CoA epoxidase PaaB subunit
MTKLLDDIEIYEVFAKVKAEDPLQHCGNVMATDTAGAKVYAYKMYDEFPWSEMVVIPRREMVTVIRTK